MERDLPLAARVLLLGAEGSGKTTLTQQLKRLGASGVSSSSSSASSTSGWTIAEGGSLIIAPTTGQDVESIALPLPPPRGPEINAEGKKLAIGNQGSQQRTQVGKSKREKKSLRTQSNTSNNNNKIDQQDEYSDAEGEENEGENNTDGQNHYNNFAHQDNIGVIEDEHASQFTPGIQSKKKSDSEAEGSIATTTTPSRDLSVLVAASMKEIGGRMIAVWPRFIKKMQDDNSGPPIKCLIYVIDVANVGFLPQTAIELQEILSRPDDVSQWPALILLNKVCSPGALSLGLVLSTLGVMHQAPSLGDEGWERALLDNPIGGRHNTGCRLQLSEKVSLMTVDTWSGLGLIEVLDWLRGHAYGFNSLTRDVPPTAAQQRGHQ